MRRIIRLTLLLLLVLAALLSGLPLRASQAEVAQTWWDPAWPYRLRVEVAAQGIAQAQFDFSAAFQNLGLNHALLDLRSVRVVPDLGGVPPSFANKWASINVSLARVNL